ncbi:hypothetical protein AB0G04_42265 [Actinoplanes sp. NPDC023801]|uniref:hypothetical protein n=1 Tax=Actinoplanes sp. NPDC023801 TaxID=3154595 RepID=UPI0033F12348
MEVGHHADECATWVADGRALVVAPNETRGLRSRDLRRIEEFLSGPTTLPGAG